MKLLSPSQPCFKHIFPLLIIIIKDYFKLAFVGQLIDKLQLMNQIKTHSFDNNVPTRQK
jgi:hypothetical protein